MYIHTDWRTYPFLYPIINQYFTLRNLIVWKKGTILSAGNWYRFCYEMIIFASNGDSKREFGADKRDIWDIPLAEACIARRQHPSQKPLELVETMIKNSSHEGDTVLDCFVGSGTTAEACIKNNRHFIGFELDEKYFNIANERIVKACAEREQQLFN